MRISIILSLLVTLSGCGKRDGRHVDGKSGQLTKEYGVKNGRLHGKLIYRYKNGQKRSEYNYKNGEITGIHKSWYPTGRLSSKCFYRYSLLHGREEMWYPNGRKRLARTFDRGRLHGLCKNWNIKGDLVSKGTYKNSHPYNGSFLMFDRFKDMWEIKVYEKGIPVSSTRYDEKLIGVAPPSNSTQPNKPADNEPKDQPQPE